MDKSPQNSSNSKSKRTPLGGGKRSRKRQCKDAAQARWQPKNADQQLSEMQVDNVVSEHVLAAHGDATVSSREDLHAGQDNVPLPDEQPDKQCTARRKLDLMRKYVGEADDTDNDKERCFMEMRSLQSLFSAVACSECGGSLTVSFGDKMGYSREIRLACEVCTFTQQQYSCARLGGSNDVTVGFDINHAMVMCFNELGCGEAALRKFSAFTSIPGLAHNTYRRLAKKVGGAHAEVTANVLQAAVRAVHDAYADQDDGDDENINCGNSDQHDHNAEHGENSESDVSESGDGDSDTDSNHRDEINTDGNRDSDDDSDGDDDNGADVVDVMVSFDGTWHKRGFTSNYGVGIVIDVATGLVLDFEVLSKYCQACALHSKREMMEAEREEWRREHAPHCEKNYEGSSKGMEKEAALRLWGRSLRKNNMRYTKMLSDGDSVAYKAVVNANLYPVEKMECVNHCDKRMGTALRKKTKEAKLGGRRHGALTVNACTILQSYYRNAIMSNLGNAEKMRQAIWASFLHCTSTDQKPQHQQCPDGPSSWCFFNKAIANGQQPPPHKEHVGTPMSADVAKAVKPIYDRMSDLSLLGRVKHGRTQNANECLNGQIWARCPKTVHVGASRVNAAVASAVSHFNQGCSHLFHVMKKLGVTPADELKVYQQRQDRKRCAQGDLESQLLSKRTRKVNKRTKKSTKVRQERQEGPTYGPGMC